MSSHPCTTKPKERLLVYDGDCCFCRKWAARWRKATEDRVQYEPYQNVAWKYPEVSDREFAASIQYFEDGKRCRQGADAVFHVLAWGGIGGKLLAFLYDRVFVFAIFSEFIYRQVACNRGFLSLLTQWVFGNDLNPPEFRVGTRLFIKGLALIYLLAFVSYWVQLAGLVGTRGILPASQFFDFVRQVGGGFGLVPSLCWWLGAGESMLNFLCGLGMILSLLVVFGVAEGPFFFCMYAVYLSLCMAGQIFYQFQWDSLLLETGIIAGLVGSWRLWIGWKAGKPSWFGHFLIVWLLFRLLFASGMTKWLGGGKEWHDLTALEFHYFTQPLPTPLAWYVQQLPGWFQHVSVGILFFVEIVLPFFLFAPARLRLLGVIGIAGLQCAIAATGNYGFFNLLTLLLCLAVLEDRWWPNRLRLLVSDGKTAQLPRFVLLAACLVFFALGLGSMNWAKGPCKWFAKGYEKIRPFQIVNGYGLFVRMTIFRHEIQLEGSNDGLLWKPYGFRYKPGNLAQRPLWVAPYMPRLDWLMWFAALGSAKQNSWFLAFMEKILRGSPTVISLLKNDPFPAGPPIYLRARLDNYQFTTIEERRVTGNWWKSQPLGLYVPNVWLRDR